MSEVATLQDSSTEVNQRISEEIRMDSVFADEEFNCRGHIAAHTVVPLAEDIRARGLMYPVIVRRWSDGRLFPHEKPYALVAGFRRYMAYRVLNREVIPAFVEVDTSDTEARFTNLRENLLRQELNVLQEARAIAELVKAHVTDAEIGEKLGQSRGWVQTRRQLLTLPEDIQREAAVGVINQAHIRDLANLPKPAQYEKVRQIKEARERGEKPRVTLRKSNPHKSRVRRVGEILELQDYLREKLGHGRVSQVHEKIRFSLMVLGWAAGEVTDFDLHTEIKEIVGESYEIPSSDLSAMSGDNGGNEGS